ncbi:MAG: DUF502 domain-containing protein [Verrucomicrobiales bacterium]
MASSPAAPNSLPTPSPVPGKAPRGRRSLGLKALLLLTRNRFLTGLAFGVPLIVTIWLLVLAYKSVVLVGRPVIDFILRAGNLVSAFFFGDEHFLDPPEYLLSLIAVLLPIFVFIGFGVMATNVLGKRVLAVVDFILLKFPVVSFIYSGLKQAIDAFKSFGVTKDFKRVVYVDYPAPGCRIIGFVTSQYYDTHLERSVTSVFVPTAPNPMTGFVIVVDDEKVVDCDMTVEEATKMVFSAGLVSPESAPVDDAVASERIGAEAGPSADPAPTRPDRRKEEEFAKWVD